jgi:hypothetical protein
MEVTGTAFERRVVPASGRVYAPRDWRGHDVAIIVSPEGFTADVGPDGLERISFPSIDKKRVAALPGNGDGNPQLYIGGSYEGEQVLLVRDPIG